MVIEDQFYMLIKLNVKNKIKMDNNKLKDYLQDLVNQKIIHSDVRDDILHLAHIKK